MMFRRLILLLGILLPFTALSTTLTMACTGGPYFSLDNLPEMELLVRASVIDADDRGFSAIIKVEEYYKGDGPQLLTIARYNVGLQTGRSVRSYDTGCLYAGEGHRWRKGTDGYFALSQNLFGTYTDAYYGSAHFYLRDGQISHQQGAAQDYTVKTFSEDEFVALLLEAGEREEAIAPTFEDRPHYSEMSYPLMRYLEIKTVAGTRYRVNPDRSVRPLEAHEPIAISPDGAHVVLRADDHTLGFYYIWDKGYTDEVIDRLIQQPGQEARFSNDSNMVAVWDAAQLSLYMFHNEGKGNQGGYGAGMTLEPIARADLQLKNSQSAIVKWSSDSSTIAWQDETGIWRWNLYEEAEPMPVAASEDADAGPLLEISRRGRYIRYGSPASWQLFDSRTQEPIANALSSPNERVLIFVKAEPAMIGDWRDEEACAPPLQETCAVHLAVDHNPDVNFYAHFGTEERQELSVYTFPYEMELLGLIVCGANCYVYGTSWQPAIDGNSSGQLLGGRRLGANLPDIRQIVYDPFYGQPAVLRGDYRIEFAIYNFTVYEKLDEDDLRYLDSLDLETIVDSPIASIEWGQPIFYDTFMLTATEYLP